MKTRLLLLASLCLTSGLARAQQACDDRLLANTPAARFQVHADGTATDLRTGLVWMRCPLGHALDDGGTPALLADDHCVAASATAFTWGDALRAAADLDAAGGFAGATTWRVPNRKELLSIVETRCAGPAVNAAIFPDTPAGPFFTSNYYAQVASLAWATDFAGGGESPTAKTAAVSVRLVR
jgi:hypothetical protein